MGLLRWSKTIDINFVFKILLCNFRIYCHRLKTKEMTFNVSCHCVMKHIKDGSLMRCIKKNRYLLLFLKYYCGLYGVNIVIV